MRGWEGEGSECGKVGDLHTDGLRDGGGHYKKEGKKTGLEMSIRLGFAPPRLDSTQLTRDKTINRQHRRKTPLLPTTYFPPFLLPFYPIPKPKLTF